MNTFTYTSIIVSRDQVATAGRAYGRLTDEQRLHVESGGTVHIRSPLGPRCMVEVSNGRTTRTFEGQPATCPKLAELNSDAEKIAALEAWEAAGT